MLTLEITALKMNYWSLNNKNSYKVFNNVRVDRRIVTPFRPCHFIH